MEVPRSPNRRTLIQRGLLLLAGAVGLGAAARPRSGQATAAPVTHEPPAPPAARTLRLIARRGAPQAHPHLLGQRPAADHVAGHGELLDPTDGTRVGEFSVNGFCPATPYGPSVPGQSGIELQTLTLAEGVLFAMGATGYPAGAGAAYAILGGTGRFAGARGTWVAGPASAEPGGRAAVELTITLIG